MTSKKRTGRSPGNPAGKPHPPHDDDTDAVWITTDIGPDEKSYMVAVNWRDTSVTITFDRALRYAQEVLRAANRAAYDAAIIGQLMSVDKMDHPTVVRLLNDLRKDRPPLDDTATRPISLAPGVNLRGKPFLVVSVNGEEMGQWSFSDTVKHATTMLGMVSVAELDSLYLQGLQVLVGVQRETATNMVSNLAEFRDEAW